ncbi:MAG TPA: HAMP domain-containing sensor histidine kinase [Polyangiaceae bacterium]|nr:HAMP domain-containing sensor histidine kinase [Polyangiaceae bacterium]
MSSPSAFYVLFAASMAASFTAARFVRRTGRGLLLVCLLLGGWAGALLLLEESAWGWAERLLPSGMLLAGAFVHAAADLSGWRRPGAVRATWAASAAVAAAGLAAPRLLYGPGARGAGPLFLPLALASTLGTFAVKAHLWTLVREAPSARERRRRLALFAANVFAALGGGGTIALHITGLGPAGVAAPCLLVALFTAFYAVWTGETGRDRALLREAFVSVVAGGALSLAAFALLVAAGPAAGGGVTARALLIAACAFVPLDPLRSLVVERTLSRLLGRPVGPRALADEAERARESAAQAQKLAEIGQLAGAVAHEVRNPLGVILAELKLLERAGADPEGVEAVRAQVRRASRFVDDLLRYARPRGLEPASVELGAVAREGALRAARALGAGESSLRLPEGPGPAIEADASALGDVVVNLVTNALIAVEGREGALVRVSVEAGAGAARLVVEDEGPGVPPELEGRLFQAFTTGRARDERRPGTGLGLAICRSLVERQGGAIAHERPAGGGARFVVTLPREAVAPGAGPAKMAP